jgi:CheY-like chemotaxis protein
MTTVRILLIDDKKMPSEVGYEVTKVARDFNSGIAALIDGSWDLLLLDHDLADFTGPDGEERKGWHVIRWLARPENRKYIPGKIICVSYNPEGVRDIEDAINKLYRDPDQLVILDREYMERYYENVATEDC